MGIIHHDLVLLTFISRFTDCQYLFIKSRTKVPFSATSDSWPVLKFLAHSNTMSLTESLHHLFFIDLVALDLTCETQLTFSQGLYFLSLCKNERTVLYNSDGSQYDTFHSARSSVAYMTRYPWDATSGHIPIHSRFMSNAKIILRQFFLLLLFQVAQLSVNMWHETCASWKHVRQIL